MANNLPDSIIHSHFCLAPFYSPPLEIDSPLVVSDFSPVVDKFDTVVNNFFPVGIDFAQVVSDFLPFAFSSNIRYNISMTDEYRSPGPYNYCDYLCVKCEFNDECAVYAEELEAQKQGKKKLEALQDCLRETNEMLMQMIEKQDIYIPDEDGESDMKALSDIREQVANKPVVKLAYEYLNGINDFFKDYKEHYLIPVLLSDAFFDLDWYKTIITAKIQRTLISFRQFALFDEVFPEFSLEDAYHTSGVVYKALWKSLSAVRVLKEAITDYNDILTELEYLLLEITNEFRHEFPFMILMSLVQMHYIETPVPFVS